MAMLIIYIHFIYPNTINLYHCIVIIVMEIGLLLFMIVYGLIVLVVIALIVIARLSIVNVIIIIIIVIVIVLSLFLSLSVSVSVSVCLLYNDCAYDMQIMIYIFDNYANCQIHSY